MKWIKTSELIPDENKKVILRFPWHNNTRVLDYGILKPKEPEDNQRWFATDNYGSIPERETGLEWLDETPEEWISVEDRLPEIGERVLCWKESIIPDSYYAEAGAYGFFNKGVWGDVEADNWKVTHWMPLPSAPGIKDEKENDYWKKRCEAAEYLIAPDAPILLPVAFQKWKKLKTTSNQ
jgi:hypothetical protein